MYPVNDPQAVREPRPDVSYWASGSSGLQINLTGVGPDGFGNPEGGSRIFQWGWQPVGGSRGFDSELTPNDLISYGQVGTVTTAITTLPGNVVQWINNAGNQVVWVNNSSSAVNWINNQTGN
jgi:hypothetical protein